MPTTGLRIRREAFGFTIAFANGDIDWYRPDVAHLLLRGSSKDELDSHKIDRLPVGDNFHLSAPLVAWIELTRACNLPCRHCYISAGRRRANEMGTDEILRLLDDLAQQGVWVVVFLGGEPLIRRDFIDIVNHAHALGLVISVGSNGTFITQEIIDQLPRDNLFFSVSLDGIEYQQTMRIRSTFEEVRDRVLLLKNNGIPTGLMCVITDENFDEVEQILDFAIDHELYFGSTPFSPIGRGRMHPELTPSIRLAARAADLYEKDKAHEQYMMARTGLCFTKAFAKCYLLEKATRREFCGTALAYIQADGHVYPCTTCSSVGRFPAGNIRQQSFRELWENGFREIRRISWDDFKGCATCDLAQEPYFCTSRCPVMSEVYTSDPLQCGSTPYLMESLRLRTSSANRPD